LDPHVLADLQGLQLRTRHIIDGLMSGSHRSTHAGSSTEYSQHRPYAPGDDLRHVDWKAFARTDRMYVRQFTDETNLACTFLLDSSGSMGYQGSRSPLSKLEYAACLVAALAWLARHQGDAVGLDVFPDHDRGHLPPAATDQQLSGIMRLLESASARGPAEIGRALLAWARNCFRRQLLVLVSDLFGEESQLQRALSDLRQFGHEVIVFRICDRDEIDFPFERYIEFCSLESANHVALDAETCREAYLGQFAAFQSRLRLACQQREVDFLPLVSDESLGPALGRFLATRNRPETHV
jgi:uncharacterized protein (DUF58 family)